VKDGSKCRPARRSTQGRPLLIKLKGRWRPFTGKHGAGSRRSASGRKRSAVRALRRRYAALRRGGGPAQVRQKRRHQQQLSDPQS